MTSITGALPQAVHAALSGLDADRHGSWTTITLADTSATISYHLDGAEHARRRAAGLGAMTSPELIALLATLPLGERVRISTLPAGHRRLLRSAAAGVSAEEGGDAIRLARPAVGAGLAVVPARTWRRGLEQAGRFAPFCARAMLLDRMPSDLDDLRMQADFYGIGVIVADGAAGMTVVPPAPFVRRRLSVGGWMFLENLYQAVS